MVTDEQIKRINELARKARTDEGLTAEETEERAALRKAYIASFKQNLSAVLENTVIVDEHGNKRKVQKKK